MNLDSTHIRLFRPGDEAAARYICLKTGDYGGDGEPFYREDPDALARVFVDPYLAFEPDLALMLEDAKGVCGYALAALDTKRFFHRYETEWRPELCARFPAPKGCREGWSRVEAVYDLYHHPGYYCPEPYERYPSHVHIDLLPRVQGRGHGRTLMEALLERLRGRGSPGVHLGVSASNDRAYRFYLKFGFEDLVRRGRGDDAAIYLGLHWPSQ